MNEETKALARSLKDTQKAVKTRTKAERQAVRQQVSSAQQGASVPQEAAAELAAAQPADLRRAVPQPAKGPPQVSSL